MAATSLGSSTNQQILQTDLHTFLGIKVIKAFSPKDHFNDSQNHSIYLVILSRENRCRFLPGLKGVIANFYFSKE